MLCTSKVYCTKRMFGENMDRKNLITFSHSFFVNKRSGSGHHCTPYTLDLVFIIEFDILEGQQWQNPVKPETLNKTELSLFKWKPPMVTST